MSSYPPDGFFLKASDSARRLFYGRRNYAADTFSLFDEIALNSGIGAGNYIDMWNTVPWYGKVTPNNSLVVPNEKFLQYSFGTSRMGALPWVYEGASDVQSYFNRAVVHGRSDLNSLFKTFDVVKSYESPYESYFFYASGILMRFHRTIVSRNQKIVSNFKDYVTAFVRYLSNLEQPFTFGNYFASNRVSAHSTGLIISFADLNANDTRHAHKYFAHPEFKKYAQGVANFGFRVDQNAPWRIVADLTSKPMGKYLLRQNVPNIQELFKRFYIPTAIYDLMSTRELLLKGYTQYQNNREFEVVHKQILRPDPFFKSAFSTNVVNQIQYPITLEKLPPPAVDTEEPSLSFLPILEKIKKAEWRRPGAGRRGPTYKAFKAQFHRLLHQKQSLRALTILDRHYSLY